MIKINREGDFVKFSNCPTSFEISIEELRKKMKKRESIDATTVPLDKQSEQFWDFYRGIINEKSTKFVELGFEMLKFIRRRETSFVAPEVTRRYINIGKLSFLRKELIRQYAVSQEPFHFFASLSWIKHTSENGESEDNIKEQLKNEVYGFDYVCDQDEPNAWDKTKAVIEYLEKITPINVVFSGRGFHIYITFENLVKNFGVKKQNLYTQEQIGKIYGDINLQLIEGSGVEEIGHGGREMQIIRVPYSLNSRSMKISLPLTKEQFYNFNPNIAEINSVLNMDIRDRGMPIW